MKTKLKSCNDGNTVVWYTSDNSSITKNLFGRVSSWTDKSGKGNDLIQVKRRNRPTWSRNGIMFDGVDDFMTSTDNIVIHEIIIRNGVDSPETQQRIYNHLHEKYSPKPKFPLIIKIAATVVGILLIGFTAYLLIINR